MCIVENKKKKKIRKKILKAENKNHANALTQAGLTIITFLLGTLPESCIHSLIHSPLYCST